MVVIKNEVNVEELCYSSETENGNSFLERQFLSNAAKTASKSSLDLPHLANPSINKWAVLLTRLNCSRKS